MLETFAAKVAQGEMVQFRPTGSSMVPLIRSRQMVAVAPVNPAEVESGDIVLAKVSGTVYLHLVSAVDHARTRVQISNNRGRANGWTNHARVYGICVAVDGVPRSVSPRKLKSAASSTPLQDDQYQRAVAQARIEHGSAEVDVLVSYLADRGLGFVQCILAVTEVTGIGLGEAKRVVHGSTVFMPDRDHREQFWEKLHQTIAAELGQDRTS